MSAKWAVPAGAMAPPGHTLGRLPSTTGSVYHLAVAEPYPAALCGKGLIYTTEFAAPRYRLCPDCALGAGLASAADLPVDTTEAAWWEAQG